MFRDLFIFLAACYHCLLLTWFIAASSLFMAAAVWERVRSDTQERAWESPFSLSSLYDIMGVSRRGLHRHQLPPVLCPTMVVMAACVDDCATLMRMMRNPTMVVTVLSCRARCPHLLRRWGLAHGSPPQSPSSSTSTSITSHNIVFRCIHIQNFFYFMFV
jgi:hypothetical protein